MPGKLPRLTRPEMARLLEIGAAARYAWATDKPATTRKLRDLGLVTTYGVRPGPDRVHEAVCLTDEGRAVLAADKPR